MSETTVATMTKSQYQEALDNERKQSKIATAEKDVETYQAQYDELVPLRQVLRAMHVAQIGKSGAIVLSNAVDNLNYEITESKNYLTRAKRSLELLKGETPVEVDPDDV